MPKIIKYAAIQDDPVVINHQRPALELVPKTTDTTNTTEDNIRQDAINEAEEIINTARCEAEEILNQARLEAEQVKNQASQEGYQEGYKDGHDEGFRQGTEQAASETKSTIENAVNKAEQIMFSVEQEYRESILDAEREIVRIALEVARKILAREVEENPMVVLPIVKAALEKVRDQEQIVIRVNAYDYDLVLQAKHDLQIMIGRENVITIIGDHTVSPGCCMIDTPYGTVDAGIDTQFEAVKQAIKEVMP